MVHCSYFSSISICKYAMLQRPSILCNLGIKDFAFNIYGEKKKKANKQTKLHKYVLIANIRKCVTFYVFSF